jgi:hypothetical protein
MSGPYRAPGRPYQRKKPKPTEHEETATFLCQAMPNRIGAKKSEWCWDVPRRITNPLEGLLLAHGIHFTRRLGRLTASRFAKCDCSTKEDDND